MSTTETVLERQLEAFGEQDLEDIMQCYADDAIVITQSGVMHGSQEIQEWFDNELFPEFSDSNVSFSLNEQIVEDEYGYIVWQAETPENEYEFATDTFVIRDGEIVTQTVGAKVNPKT